MRKEKLEPKRDTSGLKITRKREVRDETRYPKGWQHTAKGFHPVETVKGKEAITEFLFSVTGDEFVERRNFLIEKEFLHDLPADEYNQANKKGDCVYTRRTETAYKDLCIGGPLDGKRLTFAEAGKDYADFNTREHRWGKREFANFKVIQVHKSILKG